MSVPPNGMGCDQQAEANELAALMALRELFSRDARHFMIVMMAAVADLVNPRPGNLLPGTVHLDGKVCAHKTFSSRYIVRGTGWLQTSAKQC